VRVVVAEKDGKANKANNEKAPAKKGTREFATAEALRCLNELPSVGGTRDASPRALSDLKTLLSNKQPSGEPEKPTAPSYQDALSPKPDTVKLTDILCDACSMTTITQRMPEDLDGSGGENGGALSDLKTLLSEKQPSGGPEKPTLPSYQDALSPKPDTVDLTDILLDAWSMTTITQRMPGRPPVAPWLRGLTDEEPQTTIAWRAELDLPGFDQLDTSELGEWFDAHRILTHETLTVPSRVAQKWITA